MEEKKDFAEEIKTKTEEVKEDIKAKTEEANAKMEDQFEEGVNKSKEVAGKVGTNLSKTWRVQERCLPTIRGKL